ncbi:hypothetical protein E4L95_22110 [Paracoccus liaowanqingii]|uniref:Uncharacterized protein n=1 Tax=Paracoccus liaowanqingii TaxID=2560053 RepID=A0A4Z1C4H9_9RHOB|nr:hypothetical protein [Paracoccus liaowanqingii]TGN37806.1 hypothetical protein E4L95_22110 [Paracoccus liaowanqingii]
MMTIIDPNIVILLLHIHARKHPLCSAEANAKVGAVFSRTFGQLSDQPRAVVPCNVINEVKYH